MKHASLIAAALGVGIVAACTRSGDPPEVTQPSEKPLEPRAAPGGPKVTSYTQQAVDKVTLTALGGIDDPRAEWLAFAPDGETWASVWMGGARIFRGEQERAMYMQRHIAGGSVGFSRDGSLLRLGTHDLDVATGKLADQPALPDLAAWAATTGGHRAPPSLGIVGAVKSADGKLLVVGASGVTRDRREGLKKPTTGDEDWVIALDGASRAPSAVLWSGSGVHDRIAISDRHVAAGGMGGLLVFARDALTTPIDLTAQLGGVIALAWSPDGNLLAAIGQERKVAVWRTGSWGAPAASWDLPGNYASGLAFHPRRPLLLVGNKDGHLRVYGVAEPSLAKPPVLADVDIGGPVHALAVAPDGSNLRVAAGPPLSKILRYELQATP